MTPPKSPPPVPRLLNRKDGAAYMGRSLTKFDEIKHRYAVIVGDMTLFDRVLMDRDIDLNRIAS